MLRVVVVLAALSTVMPHVGATAEPARALKQSQAAQASPFMRVYGNALPPFGFVDFCDRAPAECLASGSSETRFDANAQRMVELDEINRLVNKRIEPVTDIDLYGVQEFWTLPANRGDCEDYVLLKRHILMQRGWPSSALLITVVRDERGDGHAVLTARTAQGDFVLDNKVSVMKPWQQTGYRFIMRQSYVDPRMWMALSPDAGGRDSVLTSQPNRN